MRTTSILALDTASPAPAVTLLSASGSRDARLPSNRQASEELLAAVESCFEAAGAAMPSCERIVACAGPGSFTGVRVGLATAWGLGRALGCPVEAVSTLEAMAEAARRPGVSSVAVALDAGRGEIVWQPFDLTGKRARSIDPPARARPVSVQEWARRFPFACLPGDLIPFASISLEMPLSRALAEAVSREPGGPSSSFSAIYSRPSAAEEKLGAP